MAEMYAQRGDGAWVPAIPLAYRIAFWRRCHCGRRFWTEDGYRGHYALTHILDGRRG